MKLPKKSVVQNEVALQKKQQIDEGITIARKVDALRETLASLEKQHSDFLGGIERELKVRSEFLLNQIVEHEQKVVRLEERERQLLVPLDAKWQEVNQKEKELVIASDITSEELSRVLARDEKLTARENEIDSRLGRLKIRERELGRALEKQSENLKLSEDILLGTLNKKTETEKYLSEKEQEMLTKEANVAVRERELGILQEEIEENRRALIIKETQLRDREGTLEREINRRKNG